ncbi:immunoglobulin superfamily member 10-like [Leguminivora glycinivorella]|uniref:immunoglobulin superfamily member 10-like n=1 Tax=Leguminivora glycinivorella TaxID=1035111 RepID=UPI00200FE74F|nr:immunoglobulin superfamily member 10-like [Leguminivora glycinivorella]
MPCIFLDCQDTILKDVKNALKLMSHIHSLSIYDLDDNEESLGPHFIPQGVCIKHIHMSRTSIRDIADDTFMPLRKCLETLSIVSSKIKFMPQKVFSGLLKLISVDLTFNYIEDIPSYNFYGLPLMKLNMKGNMIRDISESAFSSLELSLSEIDLSENNLTTFPIAALAKLRHLRSLSLCISDNPLICNCERDNTWVWIQDHPKIIKSKAVTCVHNEYPKEKCDVPIISQLSVDKHKDNSVSVSWFIRNRTAIKALQIIYYSEDIQSDVKSKYLEKTEVSFHISDLTPNVNYVVCVITLHDEPPLLDFEIKSELNGTNVDTNLTARLTQDVAEAILMRSPSSECLSFNTFRKPISIRTKTRKVFDITLILNRRMGLIVGCSLGCIVFFIMVSILLYTKIKERKRIAKSDPNWSEMNDFHSIHSKEDIIQDSTTASTDNILLGMGKNKK